ncbi:Gfo/Idh/MocA family protein [Acuticoccus mangrovi]|uniref:Gfo/Idh/MocA family oxidoreductase n=1 Tax=Acuticoccus mangrovi TaxID=2796142 RepID=A0A934IL27_9HYPH|nr:Gfo/Idh/MocA family oxidoreductase [Acuticoccus mangrovi]
MSLRIGWIGCGRHARQMLLPQLGRNDIHLAAVCDVDADAAAAVARDYGVSATFDDADALLAHPGLDAIGMAVGPAIHQAVSLKALARGLPVFMEKPPAPDSAGAAEIARAAKAAGKPVVLGFMKRYSTGNKIAHNILTSDEFGPILGFAGIYMTAPTYFVGEVDYTGFFLHHCVHYMDLVPWLMRSPVADMSVRVVEKEPGKLLIHLSLATLSGAIGTLVMGTVQSRGTPMEFVQVMGDHRRVEISNIINVAYHRNPPFKADDPAATLADSSDTLVWTPNFTAAANEDHKGYAALLADTAAALRGEPSSAPTIDDGVVAMQNLERMVGLVAEALRASGG